MKKTLLAIVVAILTAFIFTSTVYADSDTDASAAETSLQFGATSGNEVYLMIGNTATVDTLFWTSLGIPSNNLIQDDSNTDVAIEVDVTMIDASEDCVLTVIGNNLISGGNTIPISKFTLTASGEFTFSSVALALGSPDSASAYTVFANNRTVDMATTIANNVFFISIKILSH